MPKPIPRVISVLLLLSVPLVWWNDSWEMAVQWAVMVALLLALLKLFTE